jgi:DNA-binding transcriptional LysR family regulator
MDLKRLAHIVALADERHFGRAAESCHLSQPAFSRSIQTAEESFGLQLFNRGTADISCTDAGSFVIERARKLLFDSRCLARDVSLYRNKKLGDIAIGMGPYPAAALLQGLLHELRVSYPEINVRLDINNATYLTDHLRNETLDFFIASLMNVTLQPDLVIMPLGSLKAAFYARPGHPLAGRVALLADLLSCGVASVDVAQQIYKDMGEIAGLNPGTPFPIAVTCNDVSVLKGLALMTDTVIACPMASVSQELAAGTLVPLKLSDVAPLQADFGIVSLRGRSFSAMAEFAIEFLGNLVTEQGLAQR